MSASSNKKKADVLLIRRLLDHQLDAEEFAAFNDRLRTDPQFRCLYIRLSDLEAGLIDEFSETNLTGARDSTTTSWTSRRVTAIKWAASVLVTSAVMTFGAYLFWGAERLQDNPGPVSVEVRTLDSGVPVKNSSSFIEFASTGSVQVPDAAVVVRADNVLNDDVFVGQRFKPGVLHLKEGGVQIEFMSGAVLALEGPAELHIESKDLATLVAGQVNASVPDRARGFVLNAPDAAVVDLGTEFGVRIDQSGVAEVEVLSGEVQLSLLGDDGSTLRSQLVNEAENVRVDGVKQELTMLASGKSAFPEIQSADRFPLSVGPDYVNSVVENSPLIYWRFDDDSEGHIRNEVDEAWPAMIHQAEETPDGIRVINGQIRLESTSTPRYLATQDSLPALNESSYSVEFWAKPDSLPHATCVGLFPVEDKVALHHLSVIEVVTDTPFIHPPGAFRFLHRNPPGRQYEVGTNVYTKGVCTPGKWQHVVVVKDSARLNLYFNGELARQVTSVAPDCSGDFRLIVGQLNLFDTRRQFVGSIDELAIYPKALPPDVIHHHFQLIAAESHK